MTTEMQFEEKFLTQKNLADRYGVTAPTVWSWIRSGKFPPPVKLAEQTTRWRLSDLLAWEETQVVDWQPAAGKKRGRKPKKAEVAE